MQQISKSNQEINKIQKLYKKLKKIYKDDFEKMQQLLTKMAER